MVSSKERGQNKESSSGHGTRVVYVGGGSGCCKATCHRLARLPSQHNLRSGGTYGNASIHGDPDHTGYFNFNNISSTGWIKVKINFGLLIKKRIEEQRVTFDFIIGDKKIEAWSSLNSKAGQENRDKLQEYHCYVLKGTMKSASQQNNRYSRSSNSNSSYRVMLDKVKIVEDVVVVDQAGGNAQKSTLKDFQEKLRRNPPVGFTEDVENVTITNGEIYRYLGCEICSTSIPYKHHNDNYYCTQCERGRKRQVCIIMRDVQLTHKDEESEDWELNNVVIYQKDVKQLLGNDKSHEVIRATTDIPARNMSVLLQGTIISGYLKHQMPKTSDEWQRPRLILANIKIIKSSLQPNTDGVPSEEPHAESTDDDGGDNFGADSEEMVTNQSEDEGIQMPTTCDCDSDDGFDDKENDEPMDYDNNSSDSFTENFFNIEIKSGNNQLKTNASPSYWDLHKDHPDTYPMVSKPSGLALIVNISFKTSKTNKRTGSQNDIKMLRNVLPKLGIQFMLYEDVKNRKTLSRIIDDFKNELKRNRVSSCFTIIMSHGHLHHVFLEDGNTANIYTDVMHKFGHEEFPEYSEKPKIFLFQTCQNIKMKSVEYSHSHVDLPNTIYFVPAMPGVKAKRKHASGTQFIQAFCAVAKKHWRTDDLLTIAAKVQQHMQDDPKFAKERSVCEFRPILFSRNFYFNGLPDN